MEVEFSERDDGRPLLVKLDEVADTLRSTDRCHVAAILAAGLEAWSLTGRDPGRFRRAKVRYESPDRGGRVTGVVESLLAAADGRPSAPAPPTG